MITICQAHYQKLIQTIQLLHKNVSMFAPSHLQIEQTYGQWKKINEELIGLSEKINNDREQILQRNKYLQNESKQVSESSAALKGENAELVKTNTMLRAQLAKNQADYSKLKEIAKGIKNQLKEKDQSMKENKQIIDELSQRAKKYKKLYHQQVKKVQKMDKIVTMLQVTQRNSSKEKQLDDEMETLQAELEELQK